MNLDTTTDLVRELISSYIGRPSNLSIETKEVPGAVYLRVRVHADDHRIMVGTNGCHVRALINVSAAMGDALGMPLALVLLEPEVRSFRKMAFDPVPPARDYDPMPALKLLDALITKMGIGDVSISTMTIRQLQKKPPSFTFRILLRSSDDYSHLLTPKMPGPNGPGETLIGSLGTLFRAYASKEGVKFNLEVVQS